MYSHGFISAKINIKYGIPFCLHFMAVTFELIPITIKMKTKVLAALNTATDCIFVKEKIHDLRQQLVNNNPVSEVNQQKI